MLISEIKTESDLTLWLIDAGVSVDDARELMAKVKLRVPTRPKTGAVAKIARPWPNDFKLTPSMTAYASERNFSAFEVMEMFEAFRDRNQSKGTTYADWPAAWRTWVRNAVTFRQRDQAKNGSPAPLFDRRMV